MRIVPTGKAGDVSDRQKELNELLIKATRLIAILIAFASAFGFFIKIVYL